MSAESPSGVVGDGSPTGAGHERYLFHNGWWFLSARWRFLSVAWQTRPFSKRYVEVSVGRFIARLSLGRGDVSDEPWTKVSFEIVRLDRG